MVWNVFKRPPPEPDVVVPQPRPEDGFGPPLFYCSAGETEECMLPRPLQQMLFGCDLCKPKMPYADLDAELQRALPPAPILHHMWGAGKRRPRCSHYNPITPYCPHCLRAIDAKNFGAPIPLLAGSLAGKTVYSAAIAFALNQGNRLAGLGGRVAPNKRYKEQVLDLLAAGVVPAKTQKEDRRRIRIHLGGHEPWPSRLMTISDSAGEIWSKSDADNDDLDLRIKSLLIHSPSSLYLLNPEQGSGYGGGQRIAPVDVFYVLKEILTLLQPSGVLESLRAEVVSLILKSVEEQLHSRGYPPPVAGSSLDPFLPLAHVILAQVQHQCGGLEQREGPQYQIKLERELADLLKRHAEAMASQPSYQDVLQELHTYMAQRGDRMLSSTKVDHRLALVISKFDLLEPALKSSSGNGFQSLDALLPKLPDNASPAQWQKALREYSGRCEGILRKLGEESFLNWAHDAFREVGVFFVSSLGRAVETFVEEAPTATTAPVAATYTGGLGTAPSAGPSTMELRGSKWVAKKRLVPGHDGTRRPTPKGVELPLMWLMLGGD